MPHCHLHGGETSPRNAEHSDIPVAPGLTREPRDNLFAVDLLLLGILALRRNPLARAEPANVDAHPDIATPREISMLGIVARGRAIVFAIWQVFKQGRELLSRLRAARHVERRSQPNAVLQGNPRLLYADAVGGR